MRRYLAVAAALAVLAGCGGGGSEAAPEASSSPAGSAATSADAVTQFGPVGLAQAADGTVWAAWSQSDTVAPVREDGTAGAPIAVGRTPLRLLELDGSLWVTTIRDGGLAELDPAAGTVTRTVTLGEQPEGLTSLDGHLFVVLQEGAALVEVDPADGAVLRRYDVGGEPRMVAPGDGALYVGDFAGGRVVRVQPGAKGKVLRSKAVCAGVQDMLVVDGTVWAACMTDNRVVGLDPQTLDVTDRIDVEGDPDGLAQGTGSTLLVSLQDGPGLAAVDTASGEVARPFTGTSGRLEDKANNDVLERDGTAFVSDYTGNRVEVVPLEGS
jgi:outer membrane protein assembly factor BamB